LSDHRCKPAVLSSSSSLEDQKQLVQDFVMAQGVTNVLILSYELVRKHSKVGSRALAHLSVTLL